MILVLYDPKSIPSITVDPVKTYSNSRPNKFRILDSHKYLKRKSFCFIHFINTII